MIKSKKQKTIKINFTELDKQAIEEHKDIHKLVASKMFSVKYEDVTNEQRSIAKIVNFKRLYS